MRRFGFGVGFSSLSSQFVPVIGGSRYFTTLETDKFWSIPTKTETGDYEYTLNYTHPASAPAGNMALMGGDLSGTGGDPAKFTIFVDASNNLTVQYPLTTAANNTSLRILAASCPVGKYAKMTLRKVSDDITLTVEAATITINRADWNDIETSFIGAFGAGNNEFSGVLANFNMNGERFYPIDKADPSTIIDTISGQDGTGTNLSTADAEKLFKSGKNWVDADGDIVLEGA